ncbi:hypothetical protein [Paenibacillus sp.]|uniref:hypothetical protein n=1 Tax=Paenibacillus sp. TaxID=58172 RepID=UPI002D309E53|nr:hypothetical protein [Paenibacillus sp.]HZG56735.1 hypothetical protein [Paenibacillus sp.]
MMFKTVCILLLTSMFAHYGQPVELGQAADRFAWAKPAVQPVQPGDAGPERGGEYATSKGVLERSLRLRSRLNTHLLMLKFKLARGGE